MATRYNSQIINDGLVLCLDVGNTKSYPRSGTSLLDLTKLGGTIATGNSPTFSTNNNGYFTFNGTNQYINVSRTDLNGGTWAYTNVTVCVWINIDPTCSTGDNNIATVESTWEYRYNNAGDSTNAYVYFASNPWAWLGPGTVKMNIWQMLTFRHGAVTGDIFSNGTIVYSTNISGNLGAGDGSNPYLTIMGRSSGGGSWAKGNMAMCMVYNKALTNDQILQNYNATKSRFGLK